MIIVQSQQAVQEDYSAYLSDESRLSGGFAETLVFPQTPKDIVELVKEAFARETPVTCSSGRTGIVGGAVPFGGTLITLEKLDRFLGVQWNSETQSWQVRIQPGFTLEKLDRLFESQQCPETVDIRSGLEEDDCLRFFKESSSWFYPPDPTEKTAQLGGTVATNASGSRSFKYGQTRRYVRRIRAVLADGTVLDIERGLRSGNGAFYSLHCIHGNVSVPVPSYFQPSVKNVAGYYAQSHADLIDLFIGSEGTLGVITEIELTILKKSESLFGGIAFFFSESDALRFVRLARAHHLFRPSVLEFFDEYSLQLLYNKCSTKNEPEIRPALPNGTKAAIYFEQEGLTHDIDAMLLEYESMLSQCRTNMGNTWGGMQKAELNKMTRFRHSLPETINTLIGQRQKEIPGLHKIGTDFAVSDDLLESVMRLYRSTMDISGLEYVLFGHIGENHLHMNVLPRNTDELNRAKRIVLELAKEIVAMGGTVSAEHGIGKIKKPFLRLMYSPESIEQMKNIKKALDPKWILGRETLF